MAIHKPTAPAPSSSSSWRARRRRARTTNRQAKGPTPAQAADAARVDFARRCGHDKRWLHAQMQRPDRGGISEAMRKQLTWFFSLPTPEQQWRYEYKREGEGGLAKKIPNLDDECTLIWEKLQEERRVARVSRLLPRKNWYAVKADWWPAAKGKGKGKGKGQGQGHSGGQSNEGVGVEGVGGAEEEGVGEDDGETEMEGWEDVDMGGEEEITMGGGGGDVEMWDEYIDPIPVREGE